ncbi:hypothetical protein ISS86_00405 [Candidatus Microgenomates bacterium]|nr:hypothetical protein [Candidatus Microgenomates bacterium]
MPAVSIEVSPEVQQVPLIEKVGVFIGYTPETERTGFAFPGLFDLARHPGVVRARRDLEEDPFPLNLDANLRLDLKEKREGEPVRAPRREDFRTKEDYANAYRSYLIQHTNAGESAANSAWRGIMNRGWWKRRPGGEA